MAFAHVLYLRQVGFVISGITLILSCEIEFDMEQCPILRVLTVLHVGSSNKG